MADTKETLICPACGCEMEKVYSNEHDIYVDICTKGCGGMFFDNRELKKFDEGREDINFILSAINNKEFKRVDTTEQRTCPVCSAIMVKNHTDFSGEIEIDECYSCGGVFLDNGELLKLRSQYETEEERAKKFNEIFQRQYNEMIDSEISDVN